MTKTLGQKIKELRVQKGLTQGELGGGKVTPSMISQIEADKANPSHRLLKWISDRLDTPIEYFLTDMQLQSEKISSFRFAQALMEAGEPMQAIPLFEQLANEQALPMYYHEIQRELAACYRSVGRLDDALNMLEQVLAEAIIKRDSSDVVQILKEMGRIEKERSNYPVAIYHWNKANQAFSEMDSPNPYEWAEVLKELAGLYNYLGDLRQAKGHYERATALLAGTSDLKGIAEVYLELGRVYQGLGEYERAAEFAQHALSINKSLNNVKVSIQTKEDYAVMIAENGEIQQGLSLLEECLAEYEMYGFTERIGPVQGALAAIYLRAGMLDEAAVHCQMALEQTKDESERASLYQIQAKTARAQGNLQDAMAAAMRSVQSFAGRNYARELAYSYSLLGELYKEAGDLQSAVKALENMRFAMEANLKERGIVL